MKPKDYQIWQKYGWNVNQLSLLDRYDKYHQLYKELINVLKQIEFETIGFITSNPDDIDTWAVIDNLIKHHKQVYLSNHTDPNKLQFSRIESVYQPFKYYGGNRVYPVVNDKNLKLDLLIVPLQLVYNQNGYILNKVLYRYLKKANLFKIGIGYQFAELNQPLETKDYVQFDWLVLV